LHASNLGAAFRLSPPCRVKNDRAALPQMVGVLTQAFSSASPSLKRTERGRSYSEKVAASNLRRAGDVQSPSRLCLSMVHRLYAARRAIRTGRIRTQDPSSVVSRSCVRRYVGVQGGLVLVSPRSSPATTEPVAFGHCGQSSRDVLGLYALEAPQEPHPTDFESPPAPLWGRRDEPAEIKVGASHREELA
jgi:hypothetical protein